MEEMENIMDNNQFKALLLHCGGDDFLELFDTLPEPENLPDNATEYQKAIIKLDNHFLLRQNKRYKRHKFRTCVQTDTESTSQYVTRLNMRISRPI